MLKLLSREFDDIPPGYITELFRDGILGMDETAFDTPYRPDGILEQLIVSTAKLSPIEGGGYNPLKHTQTR